MSVISVRVTDEEREVLEKAAKLYKGGLSSMIKRLVFEKLEDDYDLKIIEDYEKREKEGKLKIHSYEEMMKLAGLDDEEI